MNGQAAPVDITSGAGTGATLELEPATRMNSLSMTHTADRLAFAVMIIGPLVHWCYQSKLLIGVDIYLKATY